MQKVVCLLLVLSSLVLSGCTQNDRTKNFGGKMTVKIQKGKKVVNATWKDDSSLWLLTRPMRPGEEPEVLTFKQESSWGILEGEVALIEEK